MKSGIALLLATVNAPHGEKLDGEALAHCLNDASAAKSKLGHMSAFFGEIDPKTQMEFAAQFGIPKSSLIAAAKTFASWSGETYPLAA